MPSFPKPKFSYNYNVQKEIRALRKYRDTKKGRSIPKKSKNRLLLATWNIANLGLQDRRNKDYRLIAEMISWFDIIAIQEVKDDLSGLRAIQNNLPKSYMTLFTDIAGNDERLTFLFDNRKVFPLEKVGEISVPVKDQKWVRIENISRKFKGFDRNPFLAAFVADSFEFLLVNVHLYFGDDSRPKVERRALEAYATARWAGLRVKDKDAYVRDIIVLGDFNLPKVEPDDPIYKALRSRGLRLPKHSSKIGSAIATDNHYDQIFFFPGQTKNEFTGNTGTFDFDGGIFQNLWTTRTRSQFLSYLRYYISDHRPMWAEFKI
jgi:endonuclease/exonuclease/phosphatase family metal-dependent hydrolase